MAAALKFIAQSIAKASSQPVLMAAGLSDFCLTDYSIRDAFRTLSKIKDGAFGENS